MDKLEKGAKEPGSLDGKDGANDGKSPTPEELRAAQDSAEQSRKEKEELQEKLDSQKEELAKLQKKIKADESTAADRKRAELLKAGITDDEILLAQVEALIGKGDADWKAIDKLIEKRAKKIAEDSVEAKLKEREKDMDFERRDELIEERLKEWNKDKPKDEKLSMEKFKDMVGEFADKRLEDHPTRQFRDAWSKFTSDYEYKSERTKFEEERRKNGNFRDPGTGGEKGGEKSKSSQSWRDAKTQQEKEAQLATL